MSSSPEYTTTKKRKIEPPSLFSRLFGRSSKRTRIDHTNTPDGTLFSLNENKGNNRTDRTMNDKIEKDGKKDALDKSREKEIKSRLNDEVSSEIRPLTIGTFAMMASALANQALPKLLGKLLDEKSSMTCAAATASTAADQVCLTTNSNATIGGMGAGKALALVVIGGGVASFLRTTMLNRAQDNIAKKIRGKLFKSVLVERDMEWFVSGGLVGSGSGSQTNENGDENAEKKDEKDEKQDTSTTSSSFSPGAISTILTTDTHLASSTLTLTFANLLRSCSSCAFATYHMISLNPSLFCLSVSVVPVVGAAAVVLNKFVKKATAKERECAELAASFAEERLNHVETVKLSNREIEEVEHYIQLNEECVQLARKVSSAKGLFMGFMFAASGGALYVVFNAGGRAVAEGRMTSGELTSFATYSFLLGLGTSGIFKALGERTLGLVSADRIYRLMDGSDESFGRKQFEADDSKNEKVDINPKSVGSMSLEKIHFNYRSNPQKKVLSDITLELQRGQVVAVVGRNGSGKTTLASIISGLYTPQKGSISLFSNDSNTVNFHSLTRSSQTSLVQVVPQHPALFDTSICNNITYSNPRATESDIEHSLTLVNCNEFISKLDNGLEFCVGRNGMRLSGGQRQRLALARALMCNPFLLILDEPTSALDAEGEGAVTDAVHACREGNGDSSCSRALLLITHRASTLQIADLIVVLKDGKIVERGTFEELSGNKGSELCQLMTELL